MAWTDEIDRRLAFGPGMRVQRLVEGGFLLLAIFLHDWRFALPTFALTVLMAISGRLAPVALVVGAFVRPKQAHALSDLYFDVDGSRGACIVSVFVQGAGLALVYAGHPTAGLVVLTIPTASFLMSPTLGFCAGCWFWVIGRDKLTRAGLVQPLHGARDVEVADG